MVNVQMCECANVQMVAFTCCVLGCVLIIKTLNHLHILTFAHLHIYFYSFSKASMWSR